jgi:hypothetical protein
MDAVPAGAPNPVLIVDAHLEHYEALDAGSDQRLKYFQSEQVRDEIRAAGERSVLNPDFTRSAGWVETVSLFALGYALIEDWAAAKRCFTQLVPFGHLDYRWIYGRAFGFNAGKNFVKVRDVAMRKG